MTQQLLQLFRMGRTRLSNQFPNIQEKDLPKKLHPDSNSIGFLLRHISDVEYLFAKNVFGLDVKVKTFTVGIGLHDSGKFTVLEEELQNLNHRLLCAGQRLKEQASRVLMDEKKNLQQAMRGLLSQKKEALQFLEHRLQEKHPQLQVVKNQAEFRPEMTAPA